MKILKADILFKQTSFKGFAAAYNYLYAPKNTERYYMIDKRLAENFYASVMYGYHGENYESPFISKYKIFYIYL